MLKLPQGQDQGQRSRYDMQLSSTLFLPLNHEPRDGSLWYLHIRLISMRQNSWPKVIRSKVKVKYAIIQKKWFGYKSLTAYCILLIIEHMIDINK